MSDIYYTVERAGEAQYKEKMSRFLAFAIPVKEVEQARAIIKEYQNRYHDARHVCWAYMLGPARAEWQLNDNGEPSGTAGKPILGQINSRNLTDVLVVVVRYFGGIKLGTSGLIAAYREAASLALDEAGLKECHDMRSIELQFSYQGADPVMRIVKSEQLEIVEQRFDNLCSMTLTVRADYAERLSGMFVKAGATVLSAESSVESVK